MKLCVLGAIWMLAAVWPGTSDARPQQTVIIPQPPPVEGPLTPAEIQLYKRAQTLIDWTPHQVHECPFLHKVQAAGGSEQLAAILKQVAQTNALLLQNFPQVSCDEKVSSEIAMVPGGWQVRSRSLAVVRNFHYIVTPVFESGLPGFDEYRTDLNGRPATLTGLFMITSNFVSTGLYLSAADQPDSRFRLFGTEKARNRKPGR